MLNQRTIKSMVRTTGIGLHSGKRVDMALYPAAANTGLVFRRTDLDPIVEIKVTPEGVGETVLSTTLVNNGVKVSTIEHLLSALAGLGIDNLYIDLSAEEVPIMDGSAAPFIYLIQSSGVEELKTPKQFVKIKKPIEVKKGDIIARLTPAKTFSVTFEIDFDHPAVRDTSQRYSLNLSKSSYTSEVSRARTFGFMRDVEMLRSKNLGLGGSLGNAVVLDDYRVLNKALRYDDEFVKHKILDAIGDLYTLGHGIIGDFYGYKSGHAVNNLLLREMLANEDSWELVTCGNSQEYPIEYAIPAFV